MSLVCCLQVSGSNFVCSCEQGYTGSLCESDINECASNPCRNGGTCTDQVNGYICQCPVSHTGPNCEQETQS